MMPLEAGLFSKALKRALIFILFLVDTFFCRKKGPNIQAKRVVPKSNPIVKFIVSEGRRAIAIGIPRNEVLPIKPANCKVWLGSLFLSIGNKFIRIIKNPITKKAINALLIKSISIPSFNKRPITLNGIPYLTSGIAIYSDNFGFLWPRKNPKIKKGIIFIKRE